MHTEYAAMQNTDWDDLRYFLAVCRSGSLSGAALQLGVNHSTVLRRLGSLEATLGVRLFERLPAGYVTTQAGETLRDILDGLSDQIERAQRQVSGLDVKLSGTVRITSTDTLVRGLLMPGLAEFRALHPGIHLQLVINNTFLSLTKREADIALRPSNKPPPHLIGRRIGRIQTAIYASKTYLKRNEKKKSWSEHDWVAPDESLSHLAQAHWVREHIGDDHVVMRVDSLIGMLDAVRNGLGAGMLLCLLADGEKGLVRLAEPFSELDTELWILTHPDLKHVARIKALTDFLYEKFRASDKVLRAD
jgi:DNA-binding transcriptional LysR family regulator